MRAAAHAVFSASVGDAVTDLCLAWPRTLLEPAIDTATRVEAPGSLLRALEHAAKDPATALPDLQRLSDAFPFFSHALADTAAAVAQATLSRHREAAEQDQQGDESVLARHLNNLSNRFSEVGRQEEALAAIAEAAEIHRQLADQRPGAHLSDLARCLHNLSNRLSEVGRQEEALAAIAEAAEIERRLAELRPDAHPSDLAISLNNLAVDLGDVGRQEEALAAVTEAAEIYRRLADQRPDAHEDDLQLSLRVLALLQRGASEPPESMQERQLLLSTNGCRGESPKQLHVRSSA